MKNLMPLLGCLIIAAFLAPLLYAVVTASARTKPGSVIRSFKRSLGLHAGILQVNAITDGIHKDGLLGHLRADAAHSARHLLVKFGSDSSHIAVSGVTDIPLGTCIDTPGAAEDPAAVQLLGKGGTVLMVASEAMATVGAYVYAAAGGKIALAGVVRVGRLLSTATGDGVPVEVDPCVPEVAPNGSNTVAGGTLAIPVTRRVVLKTTGGVEALTLANGLPGQKLTIILATDGGDGTLTPTTKSGFSTVVFADAGDRVDLEYVDDTRGWILSGYSGTAAPPVTT